MLTLNGVVFVNPSSCTINALVTIATNEQEERVLISAASKTEDEWNVPDSLRLTMENTSAVLTMRHPDTGISLRLHRNQK